MKCPHCLEGFHDNKSDISVSLPGPGGSQTERDNATWTLRTRLCPERGRAIISLIRQRWVQEPAVKRAYYVPDPEVVVWPKTIARAPLPVEVTDPYAADYREACNVLTDSPKASAALGRRCLQALLRDKAGVKKRNLYDEIEEAVNSEKLPSDLADALHHVRVIGNLAAHPESL